MTRPRLFMDVSYTRTQHVHVGITRTVRRLEHEIRLQSELQGAEFAQVSFHTQGFRRLAHGAFTSPVSRGADRAGDKPAARLFRWITGAFFRKVVLASLLLPWALIGRIWAATSAWTFDFLSRDEEPVVFAPGDVLLLFDASWNYPVWIAAAKARAQGARIVLLMYDLIPVRHPDFCFALVPHVFRMWLHRMLPLSDAIACISIATMDDLRRYAVEERLPLPPAGAFRLGSDAVPSGAAKGEVRDALRQFMQPPTPCFAAIGSFEPKKNYGFLVEAFEGLWARGETSTLVIIGRESAESHELAERLRRHPEQGRKLLTLFDANDAEVAHAYGHCRALVFPSLAEGFGLPLVEARTRGCFVIASSLPCFVELADEGVSIYAVDSMPELQRLLERHAHDERPALPPMPAFTWSDSARQCESVWRDLLKRQGDGNGNG